MPRVTAGFAAVAGRVQTQLLAVASRSSRIDVGAARNAPRLWRARNRDRDRERRSHCIIIASAVWEGWPC